MEEIILFGAVKNIKNILYMLDKLKRYRVLEIWDNNSSLKNISYEGREICVVSPHKLVDFKPILIIPTRYESEIREQLINIGIPVNYIKSKWYCFHFIKEKILERYQGKYDYQVVEWLRDLESDDLRVYSRDIYNKYDNRLDSIPIYEDASNACLYSYWKGKRIYMKRGMSVNSAKSYINFLYMEQDKTSPHCYEQSKMIGREGDAVIVDAGAAEGFFSLERIDTAKHIYIIECDAAWLEALGYTFNPYKDKVTIISKFLGDKDDDTHITLNKIDTIGYPVNVIKLDIEGEEVNALKGAERILSQNRKVDIVACSYHNSGDDDKLSRILLDSHYEVKYTDGYMFFPYGESIVPELRKGLVVGFKEKIYHIYIWGVGEWYKKLKKAIKNNCIIDGLVDIKPDEKIDFDGIEIMSPESLKSKSFDYVLVPIIDYASVVNMYTSLGLPTKKLVCLWNIQDDEYDFLDCNLLRFIKQERDIEKYKIRIKNAPYEFGDGGPKVLSAIRLLTEIREERKSLVRFGDGEFELMRMRDRPWFQEVDEKLSLRLKEVVNSEVNDICIAIADNFGNLDRYTENSADAIRRYLIKDDTRNAIVNLLPANKTYYDAYVSRPYIIYGDKKNAEEIFSLWKKVFKDRNILLVEGKMSRMGVGNDLLIDTKSVRRVLCPDCNAFRKYEDILEKVDQYAEKDDLILIKLGPTATVLAYDLTKLGYQAIDIGQLDNEYDWYRMGVKNRVAIKGKMVAESVKGRAPYMMDDPFFDNEVLCCIE